MLVDDFEAQKLQQTMGITVSDKNDEEIEVKPVSTPDRQNGKSKARTPADIKVKKAAIKDNKAAMSPARTATSPSSVAAKSLSQSKSSSETKKRASVGSSSASKKKKVEALEATVSLSLNSICSSDSFSLTDS